MANLKLRAGKSSELRIASELIRLGIDVYIPCVDDQAIDLVIRKEVNGQPVYYDVQVKSVKGYNRIVGLSNIHQKGNNYILIVHYRHETKPDEFYYLIKEQIMKHWLSDSGWGDLVFNNPERQLYASQDLKGLAKYLLEE